MSITIKNINTAHKKVLRLAEKFHKTADSLGNYSNDECIGILRELYSTQAFAIRLEEEFYGNAKNNLIGMLKFTNMPEGMDARAVNLVQDTFNKYSDLAIEMNSSRTI